MSKNHKYLKAKAVVPAGEKKTIVLLGVAVLLVILLIILLCLSLRKEEPAPSEPTESETTIATEAPTEVEVTEETVPVETERVMLPNMKELYEQNPDTIGWVRIDGTKLDYPVMWTPDDPFKYDRLNFDQVYGYGGIPYLKAACDVDLPTTNLIIYGHNMTNGTQFRTITYYAQKNYWEEHPVIFFSTLYEEREYEILAAFYDRIYYKAEKCFKYYNFIDPETEEEFNEGIEYFKEKALYDTGVDAQWGDQLITLVTCSYHVEDGRFVVVGRLVEEEPAEEAAAVETAAAN